MMGLYFRFKAVVGCASALTLVQFPANVTFAESIPKTAQATAARMDNAVRQSANPYEIRIDTARTDLRLYAHGKLLHVYRVALGKQDSQTPIGDWHIVDKQMNWGKGFGTRWMGLDVPWGIYGIHGTNVPPSIGHFASHGCVRMLNQDVEQLYEMVPKGTPVIITGNPLAHLRVMEYGNIGADVLAVQKALRRAGFVHVRCDGRFGPRTQFSLLYFELSKGLPMDGVVGMDDYRALGLWPVPTGQAVDEAGDAQGDRASSRCAHDSRSMNPIGHRGDERLGLCTFLQSRRVVDQ